MSPINQVMTVKEVARYLKVHTTTIYRLAQNGQLPCFKIGGDWRFNKESIDHWRLARERIQGVQRDRPSARKSYLWIDLHGNRRMLVDVSSDVPIVLTEEPSEV